MKINHYLVGIIIIVLITIVFINFNCNKNKNNEGFQNYIGDGYRGYKNTDELQNKCLNWTESDNETIKAMANLEQNGLGNHNMCRNPDNDEKGIWCYNKDNKVKQYCVDNGVDYRGYQDTTVSGKKCQKWTEQAPHKHDNTPSKQPGKGLGNHNYCRNPNNEKSIWCYTNDPNKEWEYCDIDMYSGNQDTTKTGLKCQSWTSQEPHKHEYTPDSKCNAELGNHNYCRNPNGDPKGVWCYTTNPLKEKDYCNIINNVPILKSDVEKLGEGIGTNYRGEQNRTVSGRICKKWTEPIPDDIQKKYPNLKNDVKRGLRGLGDHNNCRNPYNESDGIWCLTNDPKAPKETCDPQYYTFNYVNDQSDSKKINFCQEVQTFDPNDPDRHVKPGNYTNYESCVNDNITYDIYCNEVMPNENKPRGKFSTLEKCQEKQKGWKMNKNENRCEVSYGNNLYRDKNSCLEENTNYIFRNGECAKITPKYNEFINTPYISGPETEHALPKDYIFYKTMNDCKEAHSGWVVNDEKTDCKKSVIADLEERNRNISRDRCINNNFGLSKEDCSRVPIESSNFSIDASNECNNFIKRRQDNEESKKTIEVNFSSSNGIVPGIKNVEEGFGDVSNLASKLRNNIKQLTKEADEKEKELKELQKKRLGLYSDTHFVPLDKNKKQSIKSVDNGETLTINPVGDNKFQIQINDKCLSVYGEKDYQLKPCAVGNYSQYFDRKRIATYGDALYHTNIKPNNENNIYPYSFIKSSISPHNCLTVNDNNQVNIVPCDPNNDKSKWNVLDETIHCVQER